MRKENDFVKEAPIHVSYTTHPYLQQRWAAVGRELAFQAKTRTEWNDWRQKAGRRLKQLTGYSTMIQSPPRPVVTGQSDLGEYIRQHVVISTEPGIEMPMYVLIPKQQRAAYPVMIAPHGHVSGGKQAVAGIRDHAGVAERIDIHHYDYGVQFVKEGFIVFCPDARGFGERLETFEAGQWLGSSCRTISHMAISLGQTITGMWTWDIHRLIDYIETRDDCDPQRIGCAGLSGGGLQTLWAAALDTRIRCAIISGYMYGYKASLLDMPTNCSCNFVPHLYEYMDMGDIAALIAPRPLLIETGADDNLNGASGLENVYPQISTIRSAYSLLGQEQRFAHDIFHGEHRWNGVLALPWARQHLFDK